MTAKECQDVATFLIEESHRSSVRLDMRHLVDKAFSDFIQHRNGDSESHWKDLIRSTLQEQVVELKHTPTAPIGRRVQKVSEHEIIRQIKAEFKSVKDQKAEWIERTGKTERAFYRRLQEMPD